MSIPEGPLAQPTTGHRRMSWVALIGVLLAFLFVPAILDVIVLKHSSTGEYPDQASVNVLLIGKSIALAIVVLAISLQRWWPIVLRERLRVRAWVWIIPVTYLVTALALADYSRLSTAGLTLSLTLLVGTLLIAASEELLFRGVMLTFMRDRYSEIIAALLTTAVFGLSHIPAGPLNVVASAGFGYLLYCTRRVSGGILLPIIVHALYDFSIFSSVTTTAPDGAGNASPALFLLTLVLLVVMIVGRRRAELPQPTRAPEPARPGP